MKTLLNIEKPVILSAAKDLQLPLRTPGNELSATGH